mgnify:CR=1 FL=1
MPTSPLDPDRLQDLRDAAYRAHTHAYAPYSHFPVGAALLCADGTLLEGCNVENATYGATLCAERNAVGAAIAKGQRDFIAIAIYTPTDALTPPCGICRQVLYEFNPELWVFVFNVAGAYRVDRVVDLLPDAFGPDHLR